MASEAVRGLCNVNASLTIFSRGLGRMDVALDEVLAFMRQGSNTGDEEAKRLGERALYVGNLVLVATGCVPVAENVDWVWAATHAYWAGARTYAIKRLKTVAEVLRVLEHDYTEEAKEDRILVDATVQRAMCQLEHLGGEQAEQAFVDIVEGKYPSVEVRWRAMAVRMVADPTKLHSILINPETPREVVDEAFRQHASIITDETYWAIATNPANGVVVRPFAACHIRSVDMRVRLKQSDPKLFAELNPGS